MLLLNFGNYAFCKLQTANVLAAIIIIISFLHFFWPLSCIHTDEGEDARRRQGPGFCSTLGTVSFLSSSPPGEQSPGPLPSLVTRPPTLHGRGAEKVEDGRRVQEGGQREAKLKMRAGEGAAQQRLESPLESPLHNGPHQLS